jgi:hypothetical protein
MTRGFWVTSFACAIVGLVAAGARAAGDKVAFPENYAAGTLYWVQDRPANKQVREYYIAPAAAVQAARLGQPMPTGTVITVVQYNTQQDAQGNPTTDANGRFSKTDIRGYTVMEKRTGWGVEYPAEMRNGEWEYQTFTAAKTANTNADLKTCFTCHKPQEKTDFVFSIENLKNPTR